MTIMNFQTLFKNTGYILKKEEMRLGLYQQYFSYMEVVSFIDVGNQIKPLTCPKSLTNFITYSCIEYTLPWARFKLTTLVVIGTDFIGSCQSNYHTITTMMPPRRNINLNKTRYIILKRKSKCDIIRPSKNRITVFKSNLKTANG